MLITTNFLKKQLLNIWVLEIVLYSALEVILVYENATLFYANKFW